MNVPERILSCLILWHSPTLFEISRRSHLRTFNWVGFMHANVSVLIDTLIKVSGDYDDRTIFREHTKKLY